MSARLRVVLALVVTLFSLGLLPVAVAAPAQAAPWCDDEIPRPASPLSGLGMGVAPPNVSDADPFTDPSVPMQNVYGWHYRMVTYDTGCTPGSSLMPSVSTEVSNAMSEPVGMMGSLGHALMSAVINPTWLEPIDAGVEEGVRQVRAGTWFPYVGIVVLLVAVGMLWSTRAGRLDSSATAGVWALVVLGLATYLGSYPLHATQMVDGAVQEAAVGIGTAISTDPDQYGPPMPGAGQEAVDRQWNSIVRATTYRTWAQGQFGSATSSTALTYGPDLFKSTHLTWTEAETLDADPSGAGQAILDAKAEAFEATAEAIESADPYAYSHLQGKSWGSRISASAGGLFAGVLVMLFLVVAPIGMFVGYVVIRVAVMFSPAAGLIFMVEKLRNVAIGAISKVGRFVVMGPLWLLGSLVVLRLNSAVLNAQGVALWLQLLICLVISFVAWQLLKPVSGIPGMRGLGRVLRTVLSTATGVHLGSKVGRKRGEDANPDESKGGDNGPVDGGEMPVQGRDQVVYTDPDRIALGPAQRRDNWSSQQDRVSWGTVPAQSSSAAPEGQDEAAPAGERRGSLMSRPVAMSSRRVRHLSSSSAAVAALPVGTAAAASADESPAAAAAGEPTQSSVSEDQVQDGEQSAVYDSGEGRPGTYRTVTVAPFALPAGQASQTEDATTGPESSDEAAGVVADGGPRGTFAPRGVGEDLPPADASGSPAGADGGVVMVTAGDGPHQEGPADAQQDQQGGVVDTAPPAFVADHTVASGDVPQQTEESGTFAPEAPQQPGGLSGGSGQSVAHGSVGGESRWVDNGVIVEEELPSEVHEANKTIGTDGKPVFQVYRPQGMSVVRRVD